MSKFQLRSARYGASKFKAFFTLNEVAPLYYSSRSLCILTGIGYYSLARHLIRWVYLRYVTRCVCATFGQGDWQYSLLYQGKHWLEYAQRELPNAGLFETELKAWREYIEPYEGELLEAKFNDFVAGLDYHIKELFPFEFAH